MAVEYSPGIVDLIDARWAKYPYTRDDVVTMIARIARPSSWKGRPVTDKQREQAEQLLAACD